MNVFKITKETKTNYREQKFCYTSKRKPRNMPRTCFSVRLDGRSHILYKGFFLYDNPSTIYGMPIDLTFSPLCFKYENKGTDIDNTYMSPPPKMFEMNMSYKYQLDII